MKQQRYWAFFIVAAQAGMVRAENVAEKLDCIIAPQRSVEISSPAVGILAEVLVERGDFVTTGQVLAKLDSKVEEAAVNVAKARAAMMGELLAAEARVHLTTRILERKSKLFNKKVISWSEEDEAETNKIIAEYELKRVREEKGLAQQELERALAVFKQRSLVSTVDGVVVERYKSAGEYVEEHPVLKLAEIDPLHVEVIAPLGMLNTLQKGMAARVKLELPLASEYTALVKIVDQVIDAASGTFRVRLELPNPDQAIPAGVRCDVSFGSGSEALSTLPDQDQGRP